MLVPDLWRESHLPPSSRCCPSHPARTPRPRRTAIPPLNPKETAMLYKTMALELLQNRPKLHRQLKRRKMLRGAMEFYAKELKSLHQGWKQQLSQTRPGSDESQIASEALEMALKDLEDSLPTASSSEDGDQPTLDELMTRLRARTPPA
jgi:hypothetical protein